MQVVWAEGEANGVTGFWRIVPGSQVRLYPVEYPVLLYPQTHVKMRYFGLNAAILGTQKAKIGPKIVPGQSTRQIYQWNCTRSGTQKYPVTPLAEATCFELASALTTCTWGQFQHKIPEQCRCELITLARREKSPHCSSLVSYSVFGVLVSSSRFGNQMHFTNHNLWNGLSS